MKDLLDIISKDTHSKNASFLINVCIDLIDYVFFLIIKNISYVVIITSLF